MKEAALNQIIEMEFDGVEAHQIWRCRNGHAHRGEYAQEDFIRCECGHSTLLLQSDNGIDGLAGEVSCVDCGTPFTLVLEERNKYTDYSALIRKLLGAIE